MPGQWPRYAKHLTHGFALAQALDADSDAAVKLLSRLANALSPGRSVKFEEGKASVTISCEATPGIPTPALAVAGTSAAPGTPAVTAGGCAPVSHTPSAGTPVAVDPAGAPPAAAPPNLLTDGAGAGTGLGTSDSGDGGHPTHGPQAGQNAFAFDAPIPSDGAPGPSHGTPDFLLGAGPGDAAGQQAGATACAKELFPSGVAKDGAGAAPLPGQPHGPDTSFGGDAGTGGAGGPEDGGAGHFQSGGHDQPTCDPASAFPPEKKKLLKRKKPLSDEDSDEHSEDDGAAPSRRRAKRRLVAAHPRPRARGAMPVNYNEDDAFDRIGLAESQLEQRVGGDDMSASPQPTHSDSRSLDRLADVANAYEQVANDITHTTAPPTGEANAAAAVTAADNAGWNVQPSLAALHGGYPASPPAAGMAEAAAGAAVEMAAYIDADVEGDDDVSCSTSHRGGLFLNFLLECVPHTAPPRPSRDWRAAQRRSAASP